MADEPVSMLDVSVRAGVLSLLDGLRRGGDIGILMITHDLSTAAHFADRIAVMYLGRIVEEGPAREVVRDPQHPYTKALLSVVPQARSRGSARRRRSWSARRRTPSTSPPAAASTRGVPSRRTDAARSTRALVEPTGPEHRAACVLVGRPSRSTPSIRWKDSRRSESSRSAELFARASEVLPGGVGSSARSVRAGWTPYPPFIASGTGSHITDVDGNEYVDYLMGLGPLVFGHRPPEVTAAVVEARPGPRTVFGLPYELEAEAARKVVDAVPSVDMVRFANSGSEAVGTAVRLARAVTGRTLCFGSRACTTGGWTPCTGATIRIPRPPGPPIARVTVPAGKGLLPEVADSLVVLSWNDPESFTRHGRAGRQIAAIITEPVDAQHRLHPARARATSSCSATWRREYGALLIFDEVITGFRFARGGAQEFFGVLPDITTMAKGSAAGSRSRRSAARAR